MKYTEKNDLRILTSDSGYLIHNKNSDTYSKKVYLGSNASLDDFEEVLEFNKIITDLNKENKMQQELIDAIILALDEIFNCIPFTPSEQLESSISVMSINDDETKNPIVDFYVIMIQRELKSLNDVPIRYKKQVIKALENLR